MGTPNSRRNGPLSLKEASGTVLSRLRGTKPISVMPHTLPQLLQCRREADEFFRVSPNGAQIPPLRTHGHAAAVHQTPFPAAHCSHRVGPCAYSTVSL